MESANLKVLIISISAIKYSTQEIDLERKFIKAEADSLENGI